MTRRPKAIYISIDEQHFANCQLYLSPGLKRFFKKKCKNRLFTDQKKKKRKEDTISNSLNLHIEVT